MRFQLEGKLHKILELKKQFSIETTYEELKEVKKIENKS